MEALKILIFSESFWLPRIFFWAKLEQDPCWRSRRFPALPRTGGRGLVQLGEFLDICHPLS